MKKLFGTDGIRGHAGKFPIDGKTVETIGRSLSRRFSERLGRSPKFVIGRDTRESGPQIQAAICRGIMAENGVCESAGIITTPGVAFVTRKFGLDAGIVISASHNPFHDNGIKIFLPDGKKIDKELESLIEQDIADGIFSGEAGSGHSGEDRSVEFQDAYLEHLSGQFDRPELAGFRLVIDCANGAASHLAPKLFAGLGSDVTSIHDQPDGRNINHNCGSMHLDDLRSTVLSNGADAGIAFDGDADRVLFVDEKGGVVDGDATLWILGKYLFDQGRLSNRSIVATVMSNIGLEIALKGIGIDLIRTNVGDKYVLDELLRSGSELGGEQSGHIIFPQKSLVGDGMMTALFLFAAIRDRRLEFSEMLKGFTRYPQVLVNVRVNEKRPFEDLVNVAAAVDVVEDELAGSGRLLLRYSGTENLARVMIEGIDQHVIDEQAARIADAIKIELG